MPLYPGHASSDGGPAGAARVWICRFSDDSLAHGKGRPIDCDLLAVSGGWNPTPICSRHGARPTRFDERLRFVPDTRPLHRVRRRGARQLRPT